MKKSGIKLLAGLMTAGMLMATGAIGVQSVGGITTAETVETVEHKVERNEYTLTYSGMTGKTTGFKSFDAKIKSLPAGYGYATFYIKDYDGLVLAVAIPGSIKKDHTAKHVEIYIMRNNQVYCVGDIDYLYSELRIKNGVLCGTAHTNNGEVEYMETYCLSPDRSVLKYRDYKRESWKGSYWYYDGYINNGSNNSVSFNTSNIKDVPKPYTGWDFERYQPIKFTIK